MERLAQLTKRRTLARKIETRLLDTAAGAVPLIQYEPMKPTLEDLVDIALAAPRQRLRQDAEAVPAFQAFFDAVGQHLRDAADTPVLRALLGEIRGAGRRPTELDVRCYVEGFQVDAMERLAQLTERRTPSAEIAALFGVHVYGTLCNVYDRVVGQRPALVDFERLDPALDAVGWCRFVHRKLDTAEARHLLRVLRERFPQAFPPNARPPAPVPLDLPANAPAPAAAPRSLAEGIARRDTLAKEIEARLLDIAAHLPHAGARRAVEYVAGHLFEKINFTKVYKTLNITDSSVGMTVTFLLGNSPKKLQERGQMEIAAALVDDGGYSVQQLAAVLLLEKATFERRFENHFGLGPGDVLATLEKTAGHPAYALWRTPDADTARVLAGHVAERYPDALVPPSTTPVVLRRRVRRVVERLLELKPAPASYTFTAEESALAVDWTLVRRKAVSLDQRRSVGRRENERTLAVSEDAGILYLLRRGQAALGVQEKLPRTVLRDDLYVAWLQARREDDTAWLAAEEALPRAADAADALVRADALRQQLLALPSDERENLIAAPGSPYLDVTVALVCLLAVERDHLGRKDLALAETRLAVAIATLLVQRYGKKKRRNVLVDLLVLALAWNANIYRLHGQLDLARAALQRADDAAENHDVGPYAAADLASVRAIFLRYEGTDLKRAEQLALESASIHASFDEHLSACSLIDVATIRWRRSMDPLPTIERALAGVDRWRDRFVHDVMHNNRLNYLVEAERYAEANILRNAVPWPQHGVNYARRCLIEGCLDLVSDRFEQAESFLSEASKRFEELSMPADLAIVVFYLASLAYRRGDPGKARQRLEEAAEWARLGHLQEAPLVVQLIAAFDDGVDVVYEIERIARLAGGGLGPKGPRQSQD